MQFRKLSRQKILQKQFCSIFSHFTSVKKKGIDSKTFLLEIYKANIEINLSFNQSFSNIAKISRLNLFCRLNVILLDKNNGPKKHKKLINSLIYLSLAVYKH